MTAKSIADLKRQALLKGVDDIDVDALLCFVLNKDRTYLYTWPEVELTSLQIEQLAALIERRKIGEPVAYLVGTREFWSLPIKTNTSTLIPRPDTEVLVETVLQVCNDSPRRCIDLGTGTGAIALALKSERSTWQIMGIDRIPEAVELAKENAQALNLAVEFQQGSWCDALEAKSIHVLVSNPPYIDPLDHHLSEGDVRFEPKSALIADDVGLADIKRIIEQASGCLVQDGWLFLEHGWQQADTVRALLSEAGFQKVATVKDYGGQDRVTFGALSHIDL